MGHEHASYVSPKPADASDVQAVAPEPKHVVERDRGPTVDEVLAPASDGLDANAPPTAVDAAIGEYSDAVFADLDRALNAALGALKLPKRAQETSSAVELLAGLVGTLTEIAFNYFSSGLYGVVKSHIGHREAEAVGKAAEQVSIKLGKAAEGRLSKFLENEPGRQREERARRAHDDPDSDPQEVHMMNPAAKTLLEEFEFRQRHALGWQRAEARVFRVSTVLGHASKSQLHSLAEALHENKQDSARIANFEQQIAFGWMNFCTAASIDGELGQGKRATSAFGVGALEARGPWSDAEGAIDVLVDVPETVRSTAGLHVISMSTDAGPGTATILAHMNTPLMQAPVLRRIWLQKGEGLLQQSCPLVLFPNGSMKLDLDDEGLAAIGAVTATDRDAHVPHSPVTAQVGAQLLLNWLQTLRLGKLE